MTVEGSSSWWVYIVECANGSYYTGSTHDVTRRVKQHNAGTGARYTRIHGPVKLVWYEAQVDQSAACKREASLKKLKRLQKQKLVASFITPG